MWQKIFSSPGGVPADFAGRFLPTAVAPMLENVTAIVPQKLQNELAYKPCTKNTTEFAKWFGQSDAGKRDARALEAHFKRG